MRNSGKFKKKRRNTCDLEEVVRDEYIKQNRTKRRSGIDTYQSLHFKYY